jgi:uncharacterized coiled-coil DUF342 family protein
MDNNTKVKKLIATLSQLHADRDAVIYKIDTILSNDKDDIDKLVNLFKELSSLELSIEAAQVFYAKNFKIENKEENNDSNT